MAYERLSTSVVNIQPLLETAINDLLKKIYRRLSVRQTLSNPWGVKVYIHLHHSIFIPWWKAIRDHNTEFGREIIVDRDRRSRQVKKIEIKFQHFGTLSFHISKVLNEDAKQYLKKRSGNCKLKVIATVDHPATIIFDVKKNLLTFVSKYEVRNHYDNVISLL